MNDQLNTSANKQTPWPLYLIVGTVMAVILAGYLLAPKDEEGKLAWVELLGTTNRGILLNPPVEVAPDQVLGLDGHPWAAMADNTWKMLLLVPGECADTCVQRMQELHAMRIRLRRDAERLTLGLLVPNVEQLPKTPIADDIEELQLGGNGLLANLRQTNVSDWQQPMVLLMNPVDVVMLAYDPSHRGVDILEDFEHLLELAH